MKPSYWIAATLAAAATATSVRPARADDADERNQRLERDATAKELVKRLAKAYDPDGRPIRGSDHLCDDADTTMERAGGTEASRFKLAVDVKTPRVSWRQGEEHTFGELLGACRQWLTDLDHDRLASDVARDATSAASSPRPFLESCLSSYERARKAGLDDAQPAFVTGADASNPLHNGKHTLGELHAFCLDQQRRAADQDQREAMTSKLTGAAAGMLQLIHKVESSPQADLTMIEHERTECNGAVDAATQAQVPADLVIEVHGNSEVDAWKGTLGTMRAEVCDRGDAVVKKAYEQHYGPYIKAGLKNDKLRFVIENYPGGYWLPGGAYSDNGETDPGKLARASVWYSISYGDDCARGKTYIFHRYAFGKDQKVAKETVTSYCGDPGKKALR